MRLPGQHGACEAVTLVALRSIVDLSLWGMTMRLARRWYARPASLCRHLPGAK
jgi:hypothetical protein